MTRTAIAACAILAAISTTSVASAQNRQPTDEIARPILICASDTATQRAFRREHGAEARFITAEQATDAARRGERWETPRCISERQNARLQDMRLMARAAD